MATIYRILNKHVSVQKSSFLSSDIPETSSQSREEKSRGLLSEILEKVKDSSSKSEKDSESFHVTSTNGKRVKDENHELLIPSHRNIHEKYKNYEEYFPQVTKNESNADSSNRNKGFDRILKLHRKVFKKYNNVRKDFRSFNTSDGTKKDLPYKSYTTETFISSKSVKGDLSYDSEIPFKIDNVLLNVNKWKKKKFTAVQTSLPFDIKSHIVKDFNTTESSYFRNIYGTKAAGIKKGFRVPKPEIISKMKSTTRETENWLKTPVIEHRNALAYRKTFNESTPLLSYVFSKNKNSSKVMRKSNARKASFIKHHGNDYMNATNFTAQYNSSVKSFSQLYTRNSLHDINTYSDIKPTPNHYISAVNELHQQLSVKDTDFGYQYASEHNSSFPEGQKSTNRSVADNLLEILQKRSHSRSGRTVDDQVKDDENKIDFFSIYYKAVHTFEKYFDSSASHVVILVSISSMIILLIFIFTIVILRKVKNRRTKDETKPLLSDGSESSISDNSCVSEKHSKSSKNKNESNNTKVKRHKRRSSTTSSDILKSCVKEDNLFFSIGSDSSSSGETDNKGQQKRYRKENKPGFTERNYKSVKCFQGSVNKLNEPTFQYNNNNVRKSSENPSLKLSKLHRNLSMRIGNVSYSSALKRSKLNSTFGFGGNLQDFIAGNNSSALLETVSANRNEVSVPSVTNNSMLAFSGKDASGKTTIFLLENDAEANRKEELDPSNPFYESLRCEE